MISVLSWSVPVTSLAVPVYVNVYKAGGDDFRLYMPLDLGVSTTCNPRADFTKVFPGIHMSAKAYTHEGVVVGESVASLRDLCHRYTPYYTVGSTVTAPVFGDYFAYAGRTWLGIEMYALFFRYWRGSVRLRMNTDTNFSQTLYIKVPTYSSFSGMYASSGYAQPNVNIEVPFLSETMYLPVGTASPAYWVAGTSINTKFLFKAGGDDFSLMYLRAFPPGTLISPGGGTGNAGFNAYCT